MAPGNFILHLYLLIYVVMPYNSRLLLFCHKQLPQEYDDRRTVEPEESEVNEGNLNGEKTIEVGRKSENGKWTFDEVSVTRFCI